MVLTYPNNVYIWTCDEIITDGIILYLYYIYIYLYISADY